MENKPLSSKVCWNIPQERFFFEQDVKEAIERLKEIINLKVNQWNGVTPVKNVNETIDHIFGSFE